jgi:asparaginyl-tRNA synthetase
LTVSGQLEAETFACALSNVYTFGPTFRAENSNTARHAAEFWMIEPEMAFCDLAGDMDLAETFVKRWRAACWSSAGRTSSFCGICGPGVRAPGVCGGPAVPAAGVCGGREDPAGSGRKFEFRWRRALNLQSEHERYLTEEHCQSPVTVFNYPREIKPFYMRLNDDGKTVRAMDVLVPGIGEVIGGSQREERLEGLLETT